MEEVVTPVTQSFPMMLTMVFGFLSLIVTSIMAPLLIARTQRKALELNRKWDLEDRAEQARKHELLASVVEVTAADILHHAKQPVMDALIDKFRDPGAMSDQEMVQFIQRLDVIATDHRLVTPQQPAARMMLDRALKIARERNLTVNTRAELGENRAVLEVMRVEAEPNRGKHDFGEKRMEGTGEKSTDKRVDAKDQPTVETLKATIDRIDENTAAIRDVGAKRSKTIDRIDDTTTVIKEVVVETLKPDSEKSDGEKANASKLLDKIEATTVEIEAKEVHVDTPKEK